MKKRDQYRVLALFDREISRNVYVRTEKEAQAMAFALSQVDRDARVRPVKSDVSKGAVGYGFKFVVEILVRREIR